MAISFSCPSCRARIEVADEHAGQQGQCPRCEQLVQIPTEAMPPLLLPPVETPTVALPPADPWAAPEEDEPQIDDAPAKKPKPKTRKAVTKTAPPLRLWAWAIGGTLLIITFGLFLSSLAVLIFWRRTETPPNVDRLVGVSEPDRLQKDRLILKGGFVQVRDVIRPQDLVDPEDPNCRCKRYQIDLKADRDYWFEQESFNFAPWFRIEEQRRLLKVDCINDAKLAKATLNFRPPADGVYMVFVSTIEPGFGEFTFTVRERPAPKAFIP